MRKLLALVLAFVFLCAPVLEISATAQTNEEVPYKELILDFDMDLIKSVGHQDLSGAACSCFAMAYVRTITDKKIHYFYEYNDYGNNQYSVNCSWDKYLYYGHGVETENEAYFELYNAIKKGKPAIAQVNGSPQHYVTVVGFENVTSLDNLSASNFLILDPAGRSFEIANMATAGYRLNRFNSTDGSSNHYQVVLPYGSIPQGEFSSVIPNDSGITYTCSSFISNDEHREYIDTMMQYYITSNALLSSALDDGKSVVFMFEGGSDNYPSNTYSNSGSNVRNQAVTIVIKKVNGIYSIVFYDENSSSIPSQPEDTSGGAYDRQTVILDGIYQIQTCNHQGKYGALNVITNQGYYTPSNNKDGLINKASGINIHTRSSTTAGYGDSAWSWGCQLIGTGNTSDNSFNSFMKVVTGINYNVWLSYSSKQFNTIASSQNVGYYVVDRQLAKQGLRNIYTETAINAITQFSTESSRNAKSNYLSNCEKTSCDLLVEVTETCNLYTLPCNAYTAADYGCVSEKLSQKFYAGDTFTTIAIYKNTENHYWYEVVFSDGTVGYIYSTHTEMIRVNAPRMEGGWFDSNISGAKPLNGTLKTNGTINYVQANVYKGFNITSGNAVISSDNHPVNNNIYGLRGSTVDNTLHFERLTTGYYTLAIEAEYSSKYVSNGTLKTTGLCSTIAYYNFTFGSPGEPDHAETPNIHYWISEDIYGETADEYIQGKQYFLCYRLYDSVTGNNWDEVSRNDYEVTLQVFDPYGNYIADYTAGVDQEWIDFYTEYSGSYTVRIYMNGDFIFDTEFSIYVDSNSYYVHYDANGGDYAPSSQEINPLESEYLTEELPSRFGYNFIGWSTDPYANYAMYQPGQYFDAGVDTTLYAVWEQHVFEDYLGFVANAQINYPGGGYYFGFVPSRSGTYYIRGLDTTDTRGTLYNGNGNYLTFDDDSAGDLQFEFGFYLNAGETYFIYIDFYDAELTGSPLYEVELYQQKYVYFDAQGGYNEPDAQELDEGYIIIPDEIPSRFGYNFLGWSTDSNATYAEYIPDDYLYATDSTTLYAVWGTKQATVVDEIALDADILYSGYGEYIAFTPSVSTSYMIWGLEEDDNCVYLYDAQGNQLAYDDDSGYDYQFELVYYLEAGQTYYVYVGLYGGSVGETYFAISRGTVLSYYANGGYGTPESHFVYCGAGSSISDEIPWRDGYEFLGWSRNQYATSAEYMPGDVLYTNQKVTLYAVWKADAPAYILGDVTGDGVINQYDYICVKRHCMGTFSIEESSLAAADITGDGKVDQYDYIYIKRHCMGTYTIG